MREGLKAAKPVWHLLGLQAPKLPPAGLPDGWGRTAYRRWPCFLLAFWGCGLPCARINRVRIQGQVSVGAAYTWKWQQPLSPS